MTTTLPGTVPDLVRAADLVAYQRGDQQRAVLAAQALVRAYCGWHIAPQVTETVTVPGWARDVLLLPTMYLTDVSAVAVGGCALDPTTLVVHREGYLRRTGTWFTLTATPVDGEDWVGSDWPWWGEGSLYWSDLPPLPATVTMTHGYEVPPPDLVNTVTAIAARGIAAPAGVDQVQRGPFMYHYTSASLMDLDRQVLDHYRLPTQP